MNIAYVYRVCTQLLISGACMLLLAGCGPQPGTADKAGTGTAQRQAAADNSVAAPQPLPGGPRGLMLVTGITGQQGGAVAVELHKRGYPLRGLSRDINSPQAQALAAQGIAMVQGDFSDPASVQAAVTGVTGIFLNTPNGPDEVTQGKTVIDAAKSAGVRHIVYSTYTSADPQLGRPGMPKAEVESYLRNSGIGYTILRPVTFMENFARMKSAILRDGIRDPRKPDTRMLYISVKDIAFFCGEAFDHPAGWLGRELNIASDTFTNPELAEIIGRVTGTPVSYTRITWDEWGKGMPPGLVDLYRWYENSGFSVDVAGLRKQYPNLYTMERYLRENGWEHTAE